MTARTPCKSESSHMWISLKIERDDDGKHFTETGYCYRCFTDKQWRLIKDTDGELILA